MPTSNPVIIAISGWKRSGKDTAAEFLIKNFGATRIAFADPLKNTVAGQFDMSRTFIDDPATKESPLLHLPVNPKDPFTRMIAEFMFKEFRNKDGLQPAGFHYSPFNGEFLGNFPGKGSIPGSSLADQLYWTPRALCILEGSTKRSTDPDYWVKRAVSQTETGLYVISDLRYVNEAETLKKTGATVLTIRINRFDSSPSTDPSERDLDNYNFDVVISNKTTIEDLFHLIETTLTERGLITSNRSQAY